VDLAEPRAGSEMHRPRWVGDCKRTLGRLKSGTKTTPHRVHRRSVRVDGGSSGPSKPLKLLKDGEEKEDAIRDYLPNPNAKIDDQFVTLLLDKVQDDDETHWDICKDTSVWVNGLSGDVEHFGARVKGDATHHNPVVLDPRGMGPCQNCNTMCSIIEPCHNCGNAKQDTDLWRKRSTRGKWCSP